MFSLPGAVVRLLQNTQQGDVFCPLFFFLRGVQESDGVKDRGLCPYTVKHGFQEDDTGKTRTRQFVRSIHQPRRPADVVPQSGDQGICGIVSDHRSPCVEQLECLLRHVQGVLPQRDASRVSALLLRTLRQGAVAAVVQHLEQLHNHLKIPSIP